MELLPHDVVEEILEKLPTKSLLRFKSVSKQWKSTIESRVFQHNHLNRQKSKNPDLLWVNIDHNLQKLENIITLELESSISHNIQIPWENNHYIFCINSCDGLICFYNGYDSVVIFNPTTRWYRTLPPSAYQQRPNPRWRQFNQLGFGKDEINGLYKPVWLYNSFEFNSANPTTCEVFDFKINAWRFIEPSSPLRISHLGDPVYINGLLYWLTKEEENRSVLSLDLDTETFEIVCKAPFSEMVIFNLDDNLSNYDEGHVIWSWNLEEKTWKKMYFIDLQKICPFFEDCECEVTTPLVFVQDKMKKNNKLILFEYYCCGRGGDEDLDQQIVLYDFQTTSYKVVAKREYSKTLCYFQSLISIF